MPGRVSYGGREGNGPFRRGARSAVPGPRCTVRFSLSGGQQINLHFSKTRDFVASRVRRTPPEGGVHAQIPILAGNMCRLARPVAAVLAGLLVVGTGFTFSPRVRLRARSVLSTRRPSAASPGETRKSRPKYVPGRIDDPDYVRIFDTTLRDGEQSPGATLTSGEKLEIAKMLAKLGGQYRFHSRRRAVPWLSTRGSPPLSHMLGSVSPERLTRDLWADLSLSLSAVDIIEAGFPIASPDDFEAVKQIAEIVGNEVFEDGYVPVICGLSRANEKDIKRWGGVS